MSAPASRAWGWGAVALTGLLVAARLALMAHASADLSPTEAALWRAAPSPFAPGADVPPLAAQLAALARLVSPDPAHALRGLALLAQVIAAAGIWALARRLYDGRVALGACAVFLTVPAVTLTGALSGPLALGGVAWVCALHAVLNALRTGLAGWWLAVGLISGLGFLCSPSMALFVPSLIFYALLSPETRGLGRRPAPWLALGIALVLAVPGLPGAVPFPPFPAPGLAGAGATLALGALLLGPLLAFVLAWAGSHPGGASRSVEPGDPRGRQGFRTRFLVAFSLPGLALPPLAALAGIPVAPGDGAALAAVTASILGTAWLARPAWARAVLAASLGLHLAATALIWRADTVSRPLGLALPRALDPWGPGRGLAQTLPWGQTLIARYPALGFAFDDPALGHGLEAQWRLASPVAVPDPESPPPPGTVWITRADDAAARARCPACRPAGFLYLETGPGRWLRLHAFLSPSPSS
ncbi:glycosyltransferase family 39 protein [Pararhodospirillum oryzae]|uniref:Glycosyl transferase n=1 Tax=Pararhodospirillum oryzae TaxID=478448 RepID=A0A512HAN2_9PROT|nr:glycosyltransferase family 39 protein [Pararhodospirillum oryzae]GEO82516.1 glycosyl transferase [Pararhodospirillum oryzae]